MSKVLFFFGVACFVFISNAAVSQPSAERNQLIIMLTDKNEPYFEQEVRPGLTLYSLARGFQLGIADLLALNPGLDTASLSVGSTVKVPVTSLNFKSVDGGSGRDGTPAFYQVRPGDNWFRISRVYFQGDTEAMEALNSHLPRGLQPGELVQVGWILSTVPTRGMQQVRTVKYRMPVNVAPGRMDQMRLYKTVYDANSATKQSKARVGAAWIDESIPDDLMPDDVFVFMNGVPEQTIVNVRNPLTNREVYARVMGPVRRLGVPEHVEIVVTSDVAAMLEAHNRRFFVEISWYAP